MTQVDQLREPLHQIGGHLMACRGDGHKMEWTRKDYNTVHAFVSRTRVTLCKQSIGTVFRTHWVGLLEKIATEGHKLPKTKQLKVCTDCQAQELLMRLIQMWER